MRFGSVCSGIEAASVAWHPLGWKAAWLSEIEPFPCAVLAHHYPDVPNLGDMTTLPERILSGEVEAPDLFCGGTPCQAFSVAGLRNSLDDARGNLSLTFVGIANAIDHVRSVRSDAPGIIFWENVPGVLSTKDNAFGCFLGALAGEDDPIIPSGEKWTNAGCVYGPQRTVAWRVLDAQYFGVAQRRRRVFVVASARNDFDPAAVLFEFDGVRRDIAPSREAGKVAPTIPSRSTAGGGLGTDFDLDGGLVMPTMDQRAGRSGANSFATSGGLVPVAGTLCAATGQAGAEIGADMAPTLNCNHEAPYAVYQTAHTLRGEGFDASEDGTGRGTPLVPVAYRTAGDGAVFEEGDRTAPLTTGTDPCANILAFDTTQVTSVANRSNPKVGDPCHPLAAGMHSPAIAFNMHKSGNEASSLGISEDRVDCLRAFEKAPFATQPAPGMAVRRLTPVECERLQGFPDNYTNIPWRKKAESPDGPRYKALGNSWAVPNVRWIGKRIQEALNAS